MTEAEELEQILEASLISNKAQARVLEMFSKAQEKYAGLEATARQYAEWLVDLQDELKFAQDMNTAYKRDCQNWLRNCEQIERQRDAAQANAARYRNALVGLMACTLRADCPPDIYDAAESALRGEALQAKPVDTNPFAVYQIIQERNEALNMVRKVEELNADLMEQLEALQANQVLENFDELKQKPDIEGVPV